MGQETNQTKSDTLYSPKGYPTEQKSSGPDILDVAREIIRATDNPQDSSKGKQLRVAFDVDMTLIDETGKPRYNVIWLMQWFIANKDIVYVWSGGGIGYAQHWLQRLGLDNFDVKVVDKFTVAVDIAVDDMGDQIDPKALNAKVIIKV